jgi:hypothetical protein
MVSLPAVQLEPGLILVHGLGVGPGDGMLYAATHSGLFRVPERGKVERMPNRARDTMGFSVVGPGMFIGPVILIRSRTTSARRCWG